jgi:hypothetical protein
VLLQPDNFSTRILSVEIKSNDKDKQQQNSIICTSTIAAILAISWIPNYQTETPNWSTTSKEYVG